MRDIPDAPGVYRLYGVFKSAKAARQALLDPADRHRQCARMLGLKSGTGRCFAQQLGRCQGACCGLEDPARHLHKLLTKRLATKAGQVDRALLHFARRAVAAEPAA